MNGDWIETACDASGRCEEDAIGTTFGWGPFKALKKAVKGVGKGLSKGVSAVGKIPVVGGALKATYKVTLGGPARLAMGVAKGERIDKAMLGSLKTQVSGVKEVAPYVAMVVSVVPGVGTGVAGAIGAATALAEGKNITKALTEGVKSALPGGPIAKSAFSIAEAAVQGKRIDKIALAALPIPDAQKKAIETSVNLATAIAKGKRVDMALYDAAQKQLPKELQTALTTGIAIAEGKNIQQAITKGVVGALPAITKAGSIRIKANPMFKAGLATLKGAEEKRGFITAAGMMTAKVNPTELTAIRNKLAPAARKGFDVATAAHIGELTNTVPANVPANVKFGYAVSQGLKKAPAKNQAALRKAVSTNPQVVQGLAIPPGPVSLSFWQKVVKLFTGKVPSK